MMTTQIFYHELIRLIYDLAAPFENKVTVIELMAKNKVIPDKRLLIEVVSRLISHGELGTAKSVS
jgi:hypothetical protein